WELQAHGVPTQRIVRTGIPVRPAFDRIASVRDPQPSEPLRVLVTSGGFGVGPLRAIAKSVAAVPNVALTVVCGASEELRARVASDLFGTSANVIGFERDMPARVADAHVVVGKAGGLTVSETLTAGRPMIVIGAVPGNETLNEAFVTGGGAGFACEPHQGGWYVGKMRAERRVAEMGAQARKLVTHQAAARVLAVALAQDAAARAA